MPETLAAAAAEYVAFAGAGAVATSFVYGAVYVATAVAINQVANKVLSGSSGQGGTASTQTLNTTVRQSAAPRRLAYGRVKAGGVLAYPAQSLDGSLVDMAIILGEGPTQGIETDFWVGDELSTEAKFAGLTALEFFNGAPGQAASAALIAAAPPGEWTSAHIGRGISWVRARYQFNRNAFPRGLVFPTFEHLGRLCYDPRTGATVWTDNPALHRLDHMRCEYGPAGGVPDHMIDFDSFAAAANVCDEVLDSIDPLNVVGGVPGKVRRYSFNGVFEVTSTAREIGETLDAAMGGMTRMVNGKYRCYPGAWRAPTGPTLTAEHLRGSITHPTHQTRQQRINTARGTYREPRQDWQQIDYHEQTLPAAIVAEGGPIVQPINYPGVTNGAQAQRLARLAMLKARSAVPLVLECNYAALAWRLLDVINVNLPQVGVSGPHLISQYTYTPDGGIDVALVPHLAADHAWDHLTDEKVVPTVVRPNFNVIPPDVAGLSVVGAFLEDMDGTAIYGLRAVWTPTPYVHADRFDIQYRRNGTTPWSDDTSPGGSGGWSQGLSTGLAYDFRIRIVSTMGTFGDWTEVLNTLVSGDETPPGVPTGLGVTGTTTHTIAWTTPVDTDLMRARVYASTVNNPVGATQVAEVFGLPSTAYSTTHTPGTVPTYYWVEAVDKTGNPSARTYAGVGS